MVGEIARHHEDRDDQDRKAHREESGECAEVSEDRARRPPHDTIRIGREREDGVGSEHRITR